MATLAKRPGVQTHRTYLVGHIGRSPRLLGVFSVHNNPRRERFNQRRRKNEAYEKGFVRVYHTDNQHLKAMGL